MGLFDRFKNKSEENIKNTTNEQVETSGISYKITKNKDGSYNFGKNHVKALHAYNDQKPFDRNEKDIRQFLELDFKDTLLSFLFEGEFTAEKICIKKPINEIVKGVASFEGNWKSGKFIGRVATDDNLKKIEIADFLGEFSGEEFIGNFRKGYIKVEQVDDFYKRYKSHPSTFIEGRMNDVWLDKGVLGLPYLNTIIEEKPSSFHIIQLRAACTRLINNTGDFKYFEDKIYLIDDSNHVFTLVIDTRTKLKDSFSEIRWLSNGLCSIPIIWEDIRNNYDKFLIEINKPLNIPGFCNISKIKSFSLDSPFTSSKLEDNFHHYGETINFSLFPSLNINNEITFDCFGVEDVKPLFEIHDSFYNGTFFTELKNIKKLLNAGYVNGYGKYGQLKNIFDGNPGENIDYEKEEVKKIFDFLLKTNLLLTNARGKENRELLLQSFKHLIFNNENDAELTSNDPSLIDEIDFSQDERLGVDMKLNFAFSSKKEKEEFEKYKKDVAEGKLYLTLMQTQRLLQNEELLGYHNKLELKCLFGEQGNTEPPASENAQNCLNYLSQINKRLINTVHPKEDAEKLITIIKLIITDNY